MEIKVKKCRVCGIEKPITEFYRNRRRNDGYRDECKHCSNDYGKHYKRLRTAAKIKDISVESLPDEEWRDVVGFEGLYQISNLGRVKSLPLIIKYQEKERQSPERLRKVQKTCHGYLFVRLKKGGKNQHKTIHRMIAEAFIPNPNNYPCVNHIDSNRLNNTIKNLEWCTYAHNERWAWETNDKWNKTIPKRQPMNHKWVAVGILNDKGDVIKSFKSIRSASIEMRVNITGISNCIKGKSHTAGGYKWIKI